MQEKQKQCSHQFPQTWPLRVSCGTGWLESSEASIGAAWVSWLVPAAGEEVLSSAKSSSPESISNCEGKRRKDHGLPWRRNQLPKRPTAGRGAVLCCHERRGHARADE